MKKWLLILIFGCIGFFSQSQTLILKSFSYSYKFPKGVWSVWEESDISVIWNAPIHRISINSRIPQDIVYEKLIDTEFNTYTYYKATSAVDSHDQKLGLEVWIYDSGEIQMLISYSNLQYKYKLYSVKIDNTKFPKSSVDYINPSIAEI